MIKIFSLLLPFTLMAQDLAQILRSLEQNDLLESKELLSLSKKEELKSTKSSFMPTIDLGATYDHTDKVSAFSFKDRYSAFAKLEFDIYDGGLKGANLNKAKNELSSSKHSKEALKKSLQLQVSKNYYALLSLKSDIKAAKDEKNAIEQELKRVQKFVKAGLLAQDELDRLRASFDLAIYGLEEYEANYESLRKTLELVIDAKIDSLENSYFKKDLNISSDELDDLRALESSKASMLDSARAIKSLYYPNLKLRDTYSYFWYENAQAMGLPAGFGSLSDSFRIKEQNVLMLSAAMRIFDFSSTKEMANAIKLNSLSLQKEIDYKTKEQELNKQIALIDINSTKKKLTSAKSALVFATSAYDSIQKKYEASLVDYVTFLDALKSKTKADAAYERALNDLEVAYASYYYYCGKNLEEFLSD